jgi:hypothetical protein
MALPIKASASWVLGGGDSDGDCGAVTDWERDMIRRAGKWKPNFAGMWIFPRGFRCEWKRPTLWERIEARLFDGASWIDFR